jgi:hypothetical protein
VLHIQIVFNELERMKLKKLFAGAKIFLAKLEEFLKDAEIFSAKCLQFLGELRAKGK